MTQPIILLMLGIGLLVTASVAKKIIKTTDTPPAMKKRPERDLKTTRLFIQNQEVFEIRGPIQHNALPPH